MNVKMQIVAAAAALGVAGAAWAANYQAGGDRLTALQNNDGGWDWPLNDGNPASASPTNTVTPIAVGLISAYQHTSDAAHLSAIQDAGGLLLSKTNNFSPSDGQLAVALDNLLGGNAYSSHVMTNFYGKLADGTYQRADDATFYTTASYVNRIRTVRSGAQANMAAWDIGIGLYAAALSGADTTAWLAGLTAEIDELDSNNYYDVLGLAGALMGMSQAGADYDPVAGSHAAAGNINDLAAILAGYQVANGGFTWNSNYLDASDATLQETAYSVIALNAFNSYAASVGDGQSWISAAQLGTGGWQGYVGDPDGENNELTGEALWAADVPEPTSLTLLGLGALALRRRRM